MKRQLKQPGKGLAYGYAFDSITEKGSGKLNEDAYLCAPERGLFAVFDGATSLNPFTSREGKSGAYLAANIARGVFEGERGDLLSLVRTANLRLREAMISEGVDVSDKLSQWMTSAAAVRINNGSFDWVQVSDTNILVLYANGSYRLLVKDYDHDRKTNIMLRGMVDSGVKDLWVGILGQLKANRLRSNIDYGFIAGESEVRFVRSGTETLNGVSDILVFSDGLLFPREDPRSEDDIGAIARAYREGGLGGWLSRVRGIEDTDPETRRYIRFKPHDDATAIAVRILAR